MENIKFSEKQYLGLNKVFFSSRMIFAIFCFLAYYWRTHHEFKADVYFFIGIGIIVLSLLLTFVLHFETKIEDRSIVLDGLWTSRKVKIDLYSIVSADQVKYSKYILNRSVYNLHSKGIIRFYTRGEQAVRLVNKEGIIYLIGSQKTEELTRVIQKIIKNS